MLNEKPKLLEIKPFTIGGYEIRTCKYGAYCAFVKEEKEMKETNLEHYKEQLKTIFNEYYEEPRTIIKEFKAHTGVKIPCYGFESCTDAILNWMAQPYKKPILDNVEREYLSAVIKPFRHRVERIAKCTNGGMYQIVVYFKDKRLFVLPVFSKEASMYKGMETFKSYSLKELGL